MKQHRSDVELKKADSEISGISKHARYCIHGKRNWKIFEILQIEKEKNKFSLQKNLLVRESFEIKKHNSVFNGLMTHNSVNTNAWNPIMKDLKKIERGNDRRWT